MVRQHGDDHPEHEAARGDHDRARGDPALPRPRHPGGDERDHGGSGLDPHGTLDDAVEREEDRADGEKTGDDGSCALRLDGGAVGAQERLLWGRPWPLPEAEATANARFARNGVRTGDP